MSKLVLTLGVVLFGCGTLIQGASNHTTVTVPQKRDFKTFNEQPRSAKNGSLADLLKTVNFTSYWNEALRASIVYHLSPDWQPLDGAIAQTHQFKQLEAFFEKLPYVDGTISCVWDQSLNNATKLLHKKRVFIAANFKDNEEVLPHILVQLWHTIALLEENSVFVSIYESSSKDETGFWLEKYTELLTALKVPHRINKDGAIAHIGKDIHTRIDLLSRVRNAALEPLWDGEWLWQDDNAHTQNIIHPAMPKRHPRQIRRLAQLPPTHIMFTNDVYMCARDSVRLLYHESDVACGTDWWVNDGKLTFYDIWVARDMLGHRLGWHPPYMQEQVSNSRVEKGLHVPVKSCWNGLVVLKAAPFMKEGLKFRMSRPGECLASECKLICDDMRELGFTNMVMDPGVRMTYKLEDAIDAFKPDRVEGINVTDWADIRASPIDILEYSESDASDCCEPSSDMKGIDWAKCTHKIDHRKSHK